MQRCPKIQSERGGVSYTSARKKCSGLRPSEQEFPDGVPAHYITKYPSNIMEQSQLEELIIA
jgi:hypothetical protein